MKCLIQLFREQVAAHPSSIALDDGTVPGVWKQVTYKELDDISDDFSLQLRQYGVGSRDIVPILSTRCIGSIVAMLAVQKLRACYVPIDTDSWGDDRIENTISRVKPKLIITTNRNGFTGNGGHQVVYIAPDGSVPASLATPPDSPRDENPEETIPEDWAYLIFTSGSTGKPKGVIVNQRSISTLVTERNELPFNLNTTLDSRVLLIFSFAFDACTFVIFSTLCNGATLVLSSPTSLAEVAQTCHIWIVTPSILTAMDPSLDYSAAHTIIMGGESPTPFLVDAWTAPNRRLINVYGPTEATCTVLMAEMRPGEPIVMGTPISYCTVLLVDEHDAEADEGEMLLGGAGVAVGYYEDPELTGAAFVWRGGERFYRTKDHARRTPRGYAFCGRKDGVVKNRGFLINLESEVEPAMLACAGDAVKGAAAASCRGTLVGFVTPGSAVEGLRERMLERYSAFLVPDVVHGLDGFPSTGNGKVDRRALVALHEKTQLPQFISPEMFLKHVRDQGKELTPLEAVRHAVCMVLRVVQARVGDETSFRALGGHSLAAVMLVSTLRKLGYVTDVVSVFAKDTVSGIASCVRRTESEHTTTLFDADRKRFKEEVGMQSDLANVAPATDMQIRMVRGTIDDPSLNFIKIGVTFDNGANRTFLETLRTAWKQLSQRHSMLRTSFRLSSSEPLQLLHKEVEIPWCEEIVSEEAWDAAIETSGRIEPDAFTSFDEQDNSALSGVRLIILPGLRCRLIWTVHHSLIDGWSASVILNDLWELLHNRELPQCPQFSDAAWCMRGLIQKDSGVAKAFWKDKLGEVQSIPRLRIPPSENSSSRSLSEKHRKFSIRLSELEVAAKGSGVTSATLVYGAWAILLSRYCDSQNVVLGTVLSGRSLPIDGVEKIVGPMVNSLPMLVDVDASSSVLEFLRQVFLSLCQLIDYQWTPNSLIQEATGSRGTDYFDTLLAIQYDFPAPQWQNPQFSPPSNISISEATETPLTVMLGTEEGLLDARFVFRLSHFGAPMVERMIGHFENILRSLIDITLQSSAQPANEQRNSVDNMIKSMLSDRELHERLNCTDHIDEPYIGPDTLADALEISMSQHASYLAVEGLDRSLTYSELNSETARIARVLLSHNVKPKDVVCVIADGSVEWLLAIMAVVRTGAAYCPIDHKLPSERQRYMMSVCSTPVVLFPNARLRAKSSGFEHAVLLDVETLLSEDGSDSDSGSSDGWELVPKSQAATDDIAVVIFTSGSTGFPKAVQLQHKAILSLLSYAPARLHSKPGQRNAQLLSLGFDCCVKEVFSSLLYGATLVLKDPTDPLAHLSKVDAIVGTPSLVSNLDPADYPNLKVMTLVGEALPTPLARRWMPGRVLQNGYAPAECTLIATAHPLKPDSPISIGRPVPRVNFYLLDSSRQPVPVGVSGEIYISGIQVTPGYRNNPEETKARFLPDPFRPGWRMFKTGDIGRWLETGDIEYIGRDDNQVKVRGFRVDLGDVEASIARLAAGLDNVAVVVAGGALRAFVTPETVDTDDLLQIIRLHLPEYSTPSNITALKELPLSRNGKVDRGELAKMQLEREARLEPLKTSTERDVAKAWAELLGRDQSQFPISALDGFFDIGGHSLLQIRLAQKLSRLWHTRVPLKIIIRHQRLRELCIALDEHLENERQELGNADSSVTNSTNSRKPFNEMERIERQSRMPASYLEQEMILNHFLSNGSPVWNIVHACNAFGPVDQDALGIAFQRTVAKHEVLRSRYHVENGTITRSLAEIFVPSHTKCAEAAVDDFVSEKIQRPLDPLSEPLIQLHTAAVQPWKTVIIIVMSHIIGDGPTLNRVLQEISAEYQRITNNTAETEPSTDPSLTYLDWSHWSNHAPSSLPDKETTTFWQTHLSHPTPSLFPNNNNHPHTYHGHTRTLPIRPTLHKRLAHLALSHGLTMHQLALATTFLALQTLHPSSRTIPLGAPLTLRTEPGTEGMPGLFLDRLVVPISWDVNNDRPHDDAVGKGEGEGEGGSGLAAFLAAVRAASSAALAHSVPHRALRRIVGGGRAAAAAPLFEVMVSFHTAAETGGPGGGRLGLGAGTEVVERIEGARPRCAKFPVMLEFFDDGAGLRVEVECDGAVVGEGLHGRLEGAVAVVLELLGRGAGVREIVRAVRGREEEVVVMVGDGLPTPRSEREIEGVLGGGKGEVEGKAERVVLIREAMAECLGLERKDVSCMRSFWELGAESMDAVRLQDACEKRGLRLDLRAVFESPTADALAGLCEVAA